MSYAPGFLEKWQARLEGVRPVYPEGKIVEVTGLSIQATGPSARIGELCAACPEGGAPVMLEVVGFRNDRLLLMPLGAMDGLSPGTPLRVTGAFRTVDVGPGLIGRVLGSLGQPIDNGPPIAAVERASLIKPPPPPMARARITEPFVTGIRAIDECITCGKGQRVGIMAGSGIGKSKLIGMMARNTRADVNVIALIGERGREVREFLENDLGEEGLRRSVVVVATSDEPPLLRISGAYVATAVAEWFRDQGMDVLLLMDSVTRFAMAQREVGLAVGEPPATRGYPPSVFALLPRLLERAGKAERGTITGFYAVLVEADDLNDPVGDAVRSILDGHVALSRALASRGQYPAIDVLESVSRCMIDVVPPEHMELATQLRKHLAVYRDAEDLINIGAYAQGSNPDIDEAIRVNPAIRAFLTQGLREQCDFDSIVPAMRHALGR
ncbi:MAG TPA: FliI/YscN family ATPase [Candidatus Hydrogenedentes bacterium]|nr:FliI/YscN family ATPase [Candidatus Hydrogenedentota bacterium]